MGIVPVILTRRRCPLRFINMHSLYTVEVYSTCEFTIKASVEPAVSCSRHQTDPEQDPEAGHGEYTTQPAVQGEPPAIPDYLLST